MRLFWRDQVSYWFCMSAMKLVTFVLRSYSQDNSWTSLMHTNKYMYVWSKRRVVFYPHITMFLSFHTRNNLNQKILPFFFFLFAPLHYMLYLLHTLQWYTCRCRFLDLAEWLISTVAANFVSERNEEDHEVKAKTGRQPGCVPQIMCG